MTDAKYARVFAKGEGGSLGVKCDEPRADSLYLHFVSDEYLGGSGGRPGTRRIAVRFDQDAPIVDYWTYEGRNAILSSKRGDVWSFVKRLRTANKIAVRAWDFQGAEHTAVIDVAGFAPALAKVMATCQAVEPTPS